MKVCDYCGKANDGPVQFCAGCGSALVSEDRARAKRRPSGITAPKQPRVLNAGLATVILLAYLSTAIICELLLGESNAMRPVGAILDPIVGGVAMILTSFALVPACLRDTSPTGAAWVLGSRDGLVRGLILGLIIGGCDQVLILAAGSLVPHRSLDPLTRMAFTRGLPQKLWVVAAVVLTPIAEEMMFRGVLYGGYRKSFGRTWAAASMTVVFLALHYPYYIHVPLNVLGITAAALATLWCRLHWNAIGPAIAAHAGYNCMVAVVALMW